MHCSTVVKCIPWFNSSYSGIFFTYVVVTVRALYAPDTDGVFTMCIYRHADSYRGKRVVVVGVGTSACDAAVDLSGVCSQVTRTVNVAEH